MTTYASPVDTHAHGEYALRREPGDTRPVYRFGERLGDRTPGRYHLYAGWFCPWAQRSTLVVDLAGLGGLAGLPGVVGVSYVDDARDGRGWAFRERRGADPVNGFTLLRDAYEATDPGYDGHVSVPTVWDRQEGRVASNQYDRIDRDLASLVGPQASGLALYPEHLRGQVDALEERLHDDVNQGSGVAFGAGPDAAAARGRLDAALDELDRTLSGSRYLLGDELTLADIRLWVTLVRHDATAARVGAPRLALRPHLWRYARELLTIGAFDRTTDFSAFGGREVEAAWRGSETAVEAERKAS